MNADFQHNFVRNKYKNKEQNKQVKKHRNHQTEEVMKKVIIMQISRVCRLTNLYIE